MSKKDPAVPTNEKQVVIVCQGTGCVSSKSPQILDALKKGIAEHGLTDSVDAKLSGCHGLCEQGPIVIVEPEGVFYSQVKEKDAAEIVEQHLKDGKPVERLFYKAPGTKDAIPYYRDIPFYAKQKRLILKNCGHINPEIIEDYLSVGGYQALKKVLTKMTPEEVIEEVKSAGLRGRGGAGFPTGLKWEFCRKAPGTEKYIICNGDEGDPGAFMDRSALEADPHSLIEGMIIAAYAIGASQGYVYVRAEYPLAVQRLRLALKQAEEHNFIGEKILDSDFSFRIRIKEGAGAFVCGEETALITSIEGKRGTPRPRPPFPANSGLWGKPTTINNVKSFANIPLILGRGSDWYSSIGTENSKGTAVFALTGNISNSGLIEVPMGAPLSRIINDIGGGIPKGKGFKAVQIGGPSGGCLPESALDLPIDFDSLKDAGAMMGSGGMVVMDEGTCMVDTARYFLAFTQEESCGKCVPCRLGTKRMLEILTRITEGKGNEGDIELLMELGEGVRDSALCGLGQTCPNPVLTTVRYFRDEYEDHIKNHKCPAGSCKALISYYIDPEKCQACLICMRQCPVDAIEGARNTIHVINQEKCTNCGTCRIVCPSRFGAVKVLSGEPVPPPLPTDEREVKRSRGEKR
jgi:NADH:ubiquinone oxidoreductase subunit F (NADH-binding)/(2Fe-2S) ferredoxin/Pyruvate/2-oxoacid:ferredoxin oxidoreductase delta subunit